MGSTARTPAILRAEPRLDLRMTRNWSLRVDASVDRLDDQARVNRWQISLHRPPLELLPMPWAPLRGGVRGVVFVDEDGDGQTDPDEERVEDVVIRTDGRYQKTDRNGEFSWPGLDPGTYWLELDRGSIPGGLTLPVALPLELVIDAGRDQDLWIPLVPSSTVRGRIFLDQDFDGLSTGAEEGIADLRVALWRGEEQVSVAISDEAGAYSCFAKSLRDGTSYGSILSGFRAAGSRPLRRCGSRSMKTVRSFLRMASRPVASRSSSPTRVAPIPENDGAGSGARRRAAAPPRRSFAWRAF